MWAMPLLRQLITNLTPQRCGFNTRQVLEGLWKDKLALEHNFLQVLYFKFPHHYHSTDASCSFIHLSPTIYNFSSWQQY